MNEENGAITSAQPAATENVVESAPATTSSTPLAEDTTTTAPATPPAENEDTQVQKPEENPEETPDDTGNPDDTQPPAEDTQPHQYISAEMLAELSKAQNYQPSEVDADILDEYGNLDPMKFADFLQNNNRQVFEQAVGAVEARSQADKIETAAWDGLRGEYPELKENPSLEKALRGARIQDIIAGGDGDLSRIAKDFMAPIRENKIKAVEDVNRQVESQETLQAYKPTNAAPERPAPSLMQQLKTAVASGNQDEAQRIRHAIRKERIYGKNSNVTT